ncbi:MAG: NADH-quinone oxidoreductase subunit L [Ignavibacteria bacterium]|jgi:NADH-quinone oxidoreductase subunit L|nr:NADH-quinone oxidoreductase subunit L [Ignavibacteria bacterium]MCU7498452.1 NADH-quinone oxidoreductase subunit L [Ignavibacteria bacterium]MCU7512650.1 NADH-quinone oxidoreductase subunit L [Ignavibacteria bacterium]MCU7521258.1 NADH-quinone oxidoreductase subunit L [Ignavibacteria bacterium]MCU7526005.1 NADH-quinone oxidoreductase subunit L [Ignavibacteria bacterium]
MLDLLWIVPALPFLGFLILALWGAKMPGKTAAFVGVASIGLSALITILIGINFISSPPQGRVYIQTLWEWFNVSGMNPAIALRLDAVSLTFIFVITFVGFLIHLYSMEYMEGEEGYSRFFAYMNLFVGSMLMLVLGDNLVLLYLGWEGVGLCSYLLIGFWYKDPYNGYAARKAFIVTRIGDTAMSIGLFILFTELGTLNIGRILEQAPLNWAVGSSLPVMTAALLLGGAVGKSAQLPLQTWLPDAMAGPTPVSALIHAATMVTAGVYLIARMHVIFTLAPVVLTIVGVVGALTLLLAGFSALTQSDIKRVLAYSTISQIGYMFLALGVGAWSAAVFHFMIHAFFKALLFLGAGVVILSLHHEQNMFKMGGVKNMLPVTFWTFVIGSASLAALPLITGGFYSKDLILFYAFDGERANRWLYAAGLLGAFITALYTTRMVLITFFGVAKTHLHHKPTWIMEMPLVVLAVLSTFGGFIELPHTLGHLTIFSDFIQTILPGNSPAEGGGVSTELILQVVAAVTAIGGIFIAYLLYYKNPDKVLAFRKSSFGSTLHEYWKKGWGFDWLYDKLIVTPVVWIAEINKSDFIDLIYTFIAWINRVFNRAFSFTQSGRVRWYAMGIALGAIITITIAVFL